MVLAPLGKCTHNAGMIANRNIMYSTVGIFLFLNVVVGRGNSAAEDNYTEIPLTSPWNKTIIMRVRDFPYTANVYSELQ